MALAEACGVAVLTVTIILADSSRAVPVEVQNEIHRKIDAGQVDACVRCKSLRLVLAPTDMGRGPFPSTESPPTMPQANDEAHIPRAAGVSVQCREPMVGPRQNSQWPIPSGGYPASMIVAPRPDHEAARLLDLARYRILDTGREEPFDQITRLAARLVQAPVAVLNFVDQYRQWGKAMVGLTDTEAPREHSFCAWTINGDGPFVVEDAAADPRFVNNPMVTGEPHIRMYAGVPLITSAGHRIGSLCVTDHEVHPLTAHDLQALQDLAGLAMQALELRRSVQDAARMVDAQQRQAEELRQMLEHARVVDGVTSLMHLDLPFEDALEAAVALIGEAVQSDFTAVLVRAASGLTVKVPRAAQTLPPEVQRAAMDLLERQATSGEPGCCPPALYVKDYALSPLAAPTLVAAGVQQVAVVPLDTGPVRATLLALRVAARGLKGWQTPDQLLLEVAGRTLGHALHRQVAGVPGAPGSGLT